MPRNNGRTLRTISASPVTETLPMLNGPIVEAAPMRLAVEMEDNGKADGLLAEIERLKAENAAIRNAHAKAAAAGLTLKISEKGALSVYGLGRFPTTLYREQWEKLLNMTGEIRAFIQANDGRLKKKGDD